MKFNNEKTIFDIPSLSSEWILFAQLCFNEDDKCFYVFNRFEGDKKTKMCNITIYHTLIGDIKRFNITCRDFSANDSVFEFILQPIFKKYCQENIIELKFEFLNHE